LFAQGKCFHAADARLRFKVSYLASRANPPEYFQRVIGLNLHARHHLRRQEIVDDE